MAGRILRTSRVSRNFGPNYLDKIGTKTYFWFDFVGTGDLPRMTGHRNSRMSGGYFRRGRGGEEPVFSFPALGEQNLALFLENFSNFGEMVAKIADRCRGFHGDTILYHTYCSVRPSVAHAAPPDPERGRSYRRHVFSGYAPLLVPPGPTGCARPSTP